MEGSEESEWRGVRRVSGVEWGAFKGSGVGYVE